AATAMMFGTNKLSALALARDLSAKYGLDYRATAYDDHGNLIEHGRKLTGRNSMLVPLFRNRRDAGRRLAVALASYRESRPIVLALPRGGVPVGFEVAKVLAAPLDVLLVRKIGAPGQEELGLGAVVDGHDPQLVSNEDLVRAIAPPPGYIEAEEQRQLAEIERRRQEYVGNRTPVAVEGRTVIVVDDGIATGATVKAALRGLARNRPARLVLTVPVAP